MICSVLNFFIQLKFAYKYITIENYCLIDEGSAFKIINKKTKLNFNKNNNTHNNFSMVKYPQNE